MSRLKGAALYVVESRNYKSRTVENNTFIIHNPPHFREERFFTNIYCYSNSTSLGDSAAIVFPDGSSYSTDAVVSNVNRVEVTESALHLVAVSNGDGSNLNQGIFTFIIPDASGNLIYLYLGLYRSSRGKLILKFLSFLNALVAEH